MIDGHSLGLPFLPPVWITLDLPFSLPPSSLPSGCHSTWCGLSTASDATQPGFTRGLTASCAQLGCQLTTEGDRRQGRVGRRTAGSARCSARAAVAALQLGKNRDGRSGRPEETSAVYTAAAFSCGRGTGRIGPRVAERHRAKVLKCIQKCTKKCN